MRIHSPLSVLYPYILISDREMEGQIEVAVQFQTGHNLIMSSKQVLCNIKGQPQSGQVRYRQQVRGVFHFQDLNQSHGSRQELSVINLDQPQHNRELHQSNHDYTQQGQTQRNQQQLPSQPRLQPQQQQPIQDRQQNKDQQDQQSYLAWLVAFDVIHIIVIACSWACSKPIILKLYTYLSANAAASLLVNLFTVLVVECTQFNLKSLSGLLSVALVIQLSLAGMTTLCVIRLILGLVNIALLLVYDSDTLAIRIVTALLLVNSSLVLLMLLRNIDLSQPSRRHGVPNIQPLSLSYARIQNQQVRIN